MPLKSLQKNVVKKVFLKAFQDTFWMKFDHFSYGLATLGCQFWMPPNHIEGTILSKVIF